MTPIFSANHHAAKAAQHPYRTFARQVVRPHLGLFVTLSGALLLMQLAFGINAAWGAYAAAATLVLCVTIALRQPAARVTALVIAIIPAALLFALTFPQADTFMRTVVLYNGILLLASMYRLVLPAPTTRAQALSWQDYLYGLPQMIILGQAAGTAAYYGLGADYAFGGAAYSWVLAAAVCFGIAEELLLRGLIQQRASEAFHPVMAAVLSTVAGTALSVGTGSWLPVLGALGMQALLSCVYYYRRSIILTMVLNIVAKLVFLALLANFSWGYFR